jgi:putative transcriptional regulator
VSDDIPTSEQSISLGGRLLIASPSLADGTFDHSVIMLFEHSATTGAHGIIINHPSGTTVGDLLKAFPRSPWPREPTSATSPSSPLKRPPS